MSGAIRRHSTRNAERDAWLGSIAATGLPRDLAVLVANVCRQARLWPSERDEVARELCDHFSTGLSRGETSETLVLAFGDPRRAARMITREKRGQRPLAWRWGPTLVWGAGSAVVCAALMWGGAAWALAAREQPRWAYVPADTRRSASLRTHSEGAWEVYRRALIAMGTGHETHVEPPVPTAPPLPRSHFRETIAGSTEWPIVRARVEKMQPLIAEFRRAAAMPSLGVLQRPLVDVEFWAAMWGDEARALDWAASILHATASDTPAKRGWDFTDFGTPVHGLMIVSPWLMADARVAAEQGDIQRTLANLTAISQLGAQLHAETQIFPRSRAAAVWLDALRVARELLAGADDRWTDKDLESLQAIVEGLGGGARLRFSVALTRSAVRESLGSAFSPHPYDDGLATDAVWQFLSRLPTLPYTQKGPPQGSVYSIASLWQTLNLRQSEVHAAIMSRQDEMNAWSNEWPAVRGEAPAAWTSVDATGVVVPLPQVIVNVITGSDLYPVFTRWADRATAERDGVVVGIAVERFRRANGRWPNTLDELPASLLGTAPRDPMTGRPMNYEVVNSMPRVWTTVSESFSALLSPELLTTPAKVSAVEWTLWSGSAAEK